MKRYFALMAALLLVGGASSVTASTYSNAVTAGDYLYVSAQLPVDESGSVIVGDMQTLTNYVLDQVQHLLRVKGFDMQQVVKTEVYLTDMRNYDAMDSTYGSRFNFRYPPARDVVVASGLPYNSPIQISCIAYKHR